jgi:hypothetical protein
MSLGPRVNGSPLEAALGLAQTDTLALERAERALSLLLYSDDFYALEELLGWWSELAPMPAEVDAILTHLAEMIESGALRELAVTINSAKQAGARVRDLLAADDEREGVLA